MWDPEKKSLVSWYFTTAGFFTQATIKIEKNKLLSTKKSPATRMASPR